MPIPPELDPPRFQGLRRKLIESLEKKGIKDRAVLSAMGRVPRHLFVDPTFLEHAYEDRALPIACGQTISQPYTVAYQTELLQVQPGQKVLEIGTGSGYQCAILCELGAEVFSIELEKALYEQAKKTLARLGYRPHLRWGNGRLGWPTYAPFDRILLTAGAAVIPPALVEQLAEGGRLVAPLGPGSTQTMVVLTKENGQIHRAEKGYFRFVPLRDE
ncbi:MAG: protein-L-isoaspartate(D-aspartate) O-methyltransferase [Bacteroidia bacterium]|jgi:protein-L-isoaspartate(D-aspartate) O-methyltransferase|nr:protein-L-isoaspartate(D-aspartate) O-methyltransferase [Bacteroidia bacterium]GIV23138.1 MAG: protein-L-isoaspartate O-methyltransferase [Bacteroidia bacterium]